MSKCTKDSMKVNIVYINSSKGLYVSHNPYDQFGIFETSCVPTFSNDMCTAAIARKHARYPTQVRTPGRFRTFAVK